MWIRIPSGSTQCAVNTLTPRSFVYVNIFCDMSPSGTKISPISEDTPYVSMMRCLSLRLSELRSGADTSSRCNDLALAVSLTGCLQIRQGFLEHDESLRGVWPGLLHAAAVCEG